MQFSREEVLKIAKLARLHLEKKDIVKYQEDLSSILSYVEKLQELNTDDVPEFQHAAGSVNVFQRMSSRVWTRMCVVARSITLRLARGIY